MAAQAEGLDNFGLFAGRDTQVADLGVFGRQVMQSLTLHEALHTAQRIMGGLDSGARLWLAEDGDTVRFCFKFAHRFEKGQQHAIHYALLLMVNLIRQVAGPDWRPSEVRLETARSRAVLDAEAFANCRVSFGQEATEIVLPRSLLARPLRRETRTRPPATGRLPHLAGCDGTRRLGRVRAPLDRLTALRKLPGHCHGRRYGGDEHAHLPTPTGARGSYLSTARGPGAVPGRR